MRFTYPVAYYWLGIFLQLLVVAVVFKRGLAERYWYFCAYVLYSSAFSAGLLGVSGSYDAYFWTYWVGNIPETLLGFTMIWGLYKECLTPHRSLQQANSAIFLIVTMIVLGLALAVAIWAPGNSSDRLMQGVMSLERSVLMVATGLLVVLFITMQYLRLSWASVARDIAAGYSIYVVVSLLAVVVTAEMVRDAWPMWKAVKPLAWTCATIVWAAAVMRKERVTEENNAVAEPLVRWNERLSDFLGAR